MLGSELISVRLGGIYGLRQLARDYPEDFHLPVINLLAAFVRHPPPIELVKPTRSSLPLPPAVRGDVQEIMEFFGKRSIEGRALEKAECYTIDLDESDLSGVQFPSGSNLEGISMKYTNLAGACFPKVQGLTLERLEGAFCQEAFDHESFDQDDPPIFTDTYDSETGESLEGLVLRLGAMPRLSPSLR